MSGAVARDVASIDWGRWTPTDRATLVFVVRDGHILLIRKKRGLGAGKVNGPGGRVDPGETALQCAIREVQEELCVTPTGLWEAGRHAFQFTDGYALHVVVYGADDCTGDPQETDEAVPLWTPIDAIPYDAMWADDRLWLPLLLSRRGFEGRWIFDGDVLVDHALRVG